MKKINISDNIRLLRENLSLSQEYIAVKLGITQQAYSNIEKHPEKTSLRNLQLIAKIFNVSVSTLILEDEQFVQQNFNHHNCNIASQQHISETMAYEKLVAKLEDEVVFLRTILNNEKQTTLSA